MRTKHSLGLSTGIPHASAWMIPRSQDRLHPFWPQGNKVDMLVGQCRCSYWWSYIQKKYSTELPSSKTVSLFSFRSIINIRLQQHIIQSWVCLWNACIRVTYAIWLVCKNLARAEPDKKILWGIHRFLFNMWRSGICKPLKCQASRSKQQNSYTQHSASKEALYCQPKSNRYKHD